MALPPATGTLGVHRHGPTPPVRARQLVGTTVTASMLGILVALALASPAGATSPPARSSAHTPSVSAEFSWRTPVGDAVALATAPVRWKQREWLTAAGLVGAGALLYQADNRIRRFVQGHPSSAGNAVSAVGNPLGDRRALVPLLAGTALAGVVTDNPYLLGTAGIATESALFASVAMGAAKMVAGRGRPSRELGPHNWGGPRTGPSTRRSFPSGHTTGAFSVASVFAGRYPDTWVPPVAYTLAAATAYSRLERDKHWATDVFAGAVLGTWVGRSLVARHRHPNAPGNRPSVHYLPLSGGGGLMVRWTP